MPVVQARRGDIYDTPVPVPQPLCIGQWISLACNSPTGYGARMDLNGLLTVETQLDPAVQPFLDDHRIEGTPVLPELRFAEY